ncbi:hypothetical protein TNCV_4038511 [Trichonephila clavipes]|nr:hypothetical protein TNCV_4038511 [Trichonephila clavipes]
MSSENRYLTNDLASNRFSLSSIDSDNLKIDSSFNHLIFHPATSGKNDSRSPYHLGIVCLEEANVAEKRKLAPQTRMCTTNASQKRLPPPSRSLGCRLAKSLLLFRPKPFRKNDTYLLLKKRGGTCHLLVPGGKFPNSFSFKSLLKVRRDCGRFWDNNGNSPFPGFGFSSISI